MRALAGAVRLAALRDASVRPRRPLTSAASCWLARKPMTRGSCSSKIYLSTEDPLLRKGGTPKQFKADPRAEIAAGEAGAAVTAVRHCVTVSVASSRHDRR